MSRRAPTRSCRRSIDGMSIGTPTAVALDGRDAMLAVGDERRAAAGRARLPRPDDRARAVRLRLGDQVAGRPRADHVRRLRPLLGPARLGRSEGADQDDVAHRHPKPLARSLPARSPIAGVAWAQHRGIERVEVRVDGGAWTQARSAGCRRHARHLASMGPTSGTPPRATHARGPGDRRQRAPPSRRHRAKPFPDGATGWHSVVVRVDLTGTPLVVRADAPGVHPSHRARQHRPMPTIRRATVNKRIAPAASPVLTLAAAFAWPLIRRRLVDTTPAAAPRRAPTASRPPQRRTSGSRHDGRRAVRCPPAPPSRRRGAGSFAGHGRRTRSPRRRPTTPSLTTLVTAVTAAGLGDTLNSAPRTSPSSRRPTSAFAAMDKATLDTAMADPKGLLTKVLTYHVVQGRLTPDDAGRLRTRPSRAAR